ncbi:hypothetical protein COV19_02880 [Candidatus Woesearchaeota archaeon CG10_big_fil_rev_8_21_14_0_10_44_13]|nr:MAG: hypothetical protein COV19_02880 [Candidatus Woesearchaeota archaeon CG10_big_fil_rev_8_21_14_0_10_44_13]
MDEKKDDDLDEVYKEYKKVKEYLTKKEAQKETIQFSETIKLFFAMLSQKQLNKATNNLFWATVLLFAVAGLQLMKDLQGANETRNFINQITQIGIYIFLLYAVYQILKSVYDFIKRKIWAKKQKIIAFMKENLDVKKDQKWVVHLLIGVLLLIVIPPYLGLLSTHFHENAHYNGLQKYGICGNQSTPNLINAIPKFYNVFFVKIKASGAVSWCDLPSKEKYLNLEIPAKKEINMAGIYSDLVLIEITLWAIFIILLWDIIFTLSVKESRFKTLFLMYSFFIVVTLIIFLIDLFTSTRLNLAFPTGDLQWLFRLYECGANCTKYLK